MMTSAPWGGMDPNSAHQLWSRWTFRVRTERRPAFAEVEYNAAKWLRQGFGSVGRARVTELPRGYRIEAEVEGVPAHDPGYVTSVRRGFRRFVDAGFGPLALCSVDVKVIAGDVQDGRPRSQLVVMSTILDGGKR